MTEDAKSILTIRYTNGQEQKFELSGEEDALNMGSRIQEVLSANQMLLDLGDSILILPFQNIQSIEVSPPPSHLPSNAIRNARSVS